MAIGVNYETQAGDIIPIVKYDARAGRMFRIDRHDGSNDQVDITREFLAVIDLENLETGFINFDTGGAPDFSVIKLGTGAAGRPSDKHKPGFRLLMKLGKDASSGQPPIREFASTSKACLRGLDALHDAWLAAKDQNAGKLPVVKIKDTTAIVSEGQGKKSTNYCPNFEITGWAPRPADLQYTPKGGSAVAQGQQATPPSTGNAQAQPQQAAPAEEDFG